MVIIPHRRKHFQAGGAPWTPASIANLWLWQDASDNASVLDSGNAAASDDEEVATLNDKSGNGRHFVKGAGGPKFKTFGINNLGSLLFDGSNDVLEKFSMGALTDMTLFFVAKPNTPSNKFFLDMGNSNANAIIMGFASGNSGIEVYSSPRMDMGVLDSNAPHVHTLVRTSGVSTYSYRDGVSVTNTGSSQNVPNGTWHLGCGDNVNHWPGYIGELIIYSAALGTIDRQTVENYLLAKWTNSWLVNQGFEGVGTDNAEVWTPEPSWRPAGSYDPDYTGVILDGSQSLRLNSPGGEVGVVTNFAGQDVIEFKMSFYIVSRPASAHAIVRFKDSGGTVRAHIQADPTLLQINAGDATLADTVPTGTKLYVWFRYEKGSGANAVYGLAWDTVDVRPAYNAGTGRTALITNGTATQQISTIELGNQNGGYARDFIYDSVQVKTTAF